MPQANRSWETSTLADAHHDPCTARRPRLPPQAPAPSVPKPAQGPQSASPKLAWSVTAHAQQRGATYALGIARDRFRSRQLGNRVRLVQMSLVACQARLQATDERCPCYPKSRAATNSSGALGDGLTPIVPERASCDARNCYGANDAAFPRSSARSPPDSGTPAVDTECSPWSSSVPFLTNHGRKCRCDVL
jgi:hypothetical protein